MFAIENINKYFGGNMLKREIDECFFVKADESGRGMMSEYLEKTHGISARMIARSILSREIGAYFVGSGNKYITVFAAHHAMESICSNTAFLFVDYLMKNSQNRNIKGVDCKFLLSKYCFVIVPCVNPDGIELRLHGAYNTPLKDRQERLSGGDFSSWQANARGVDLNHNYSCGFAEYKLLEAERGITAGSALYSGEYPESEPEAHGCANLIRTLLPIAVISLHSQGEEIFFYPKKPAVKRTAYRLSLMTGYSVGEASDTAMYGGLCDYTGSLGIPSFTYELGKGKNPLSESDAADIFGRIADSIILLPTML